jgi:hypothetical protein
MQGGGEYDRHSSVQQTTMECVASWLHEAAARVALPDEPMPIGIADFGCSEGRNSILAAGHVVTELRRRRAMQPICIVHADLPTNDFNQLFANLHDPNASNYFHDHGNARPHIFPSVVGGSFYGPLLLPGSVRFATSFLAVEWLDRLPDVRVPEFISYIRGSTAAQNAFAHQAAQDLMAFYKHRSVELAPGGQLLIIIPGRNDTRVCSDGLNELLNDACADLVESGRLDRDRFERFLFPVYFRSLEELLAPVLEAGSPIRKCYRVERAEAFEVPAPFNEELRRTGDRSAYAEAYTGFARAIAEPLFRAQLLGPEDDPSIIAMLFDRVRERLLEYPDRYVFHNIEVAALLTRT